MIFPLNLYAYPLLCAIKWWQQMAQENTMLKIDHCEEWGNNYYRDKATDSLELHGTAVNVNDLIDILHWSSVLWTLSFSDSYILNPSYHSLLISLIYSIIMSLCLNLELLRNKVITALSLNLYTSLWEADIWNISICSIKDMIIGLHIQIKNFMMIR